MKELIKWEVEITSLEFKRPDLAYAKLTRLEVWRVNSAGCLPACCAAVKGLTKPGSDFWDNRARCRQ